MNSNLLCPIYSSNAFVPKESDLTTFAFHVVHMDSDRLAYRVVPDGVIPDLTLLTAIY